MAQSKMLQAIVEIAGSISPTLGDSVKTATGALDKINLKAIAVAGALGGAAIATGKAVAKAGEYLYQLGEKFDSAEDAIRIGTGATGADLEALMDVAEEVYSSVPTTMDEAAQAISDYNTRLGVTGDTLGDLSKQALSVSSMLGEDLTTVIEESSKAIQNWNIDEAYMSEAMDYMFKVSQSTGVSFTTLSTEMQTYGAQLQEVGYSFRDASTLLGQVEKEGYDATTVVTALKTAAKQAANDGFASINEGMETYISEIQNAKDDTEAYSLATKYFGSKAAATMTQAIKKGTLTIDSLTESLTESDESILGCAEDTYDFGEYVQMMKAKVEVALQPLAASIFSQISDMMPTLMDMLDQFIPIITNVVQQALPFVEQFLGGIADLLPQILPLIMSLAEALLPIFLELVKNLLPPLLDLISQIIPPLIQILETVLPPIVDIITSILPIITEIASAVLPVLVDIIAAILPILEPLFDMLLDIFEYIIEPIMTPLLGLAETILPVIVDLLKLISPILEPICTILQPIAEIIGVIVDAISTVVGWISDGFGWLVELIFGDDEAVEEIATYAKGGFTSGPSIAGEEGTEAVISFDPAYRQRNIRILEQAAIMLGMSGMSDNSNGESGLGIDNSSYTAAAGQLLSIEDFSLSEMADGGGVTYIYDFSGFTWSPTFGGESGTEQTDDFMSRLQAHEAEFFEWLTAFAKAREVQCFG